MSQDLETIDVLDLKNTETGEIRQYEIKDSEARRLLGNKLDKNDKISSDMLGNDVQEFIFNTMSDRTGPFTSGGADYAEVGEWSDGNPDEEDRVGYFVTVDTEGTISIAEPDSAIVGVTTPLKKSGFVSGYHEGDEYNPARSVVAIVGQVNVIDNGSCTVGGRCMPAEDGTAEPSSNNCGYLVISRVDEDHVRILVSPVIDMVQRIKTDVSSFEEIPDNDIVEIFEN